MLYIFFVIFQASSLLNLRIAQAVKTVLNLLIHGTHIIQEQFKRKRQMHLSYLCSTKTPVEIMLYF